jgi:hypothetical protein
MSKHKSNVHPDHYKTAGREAQGRDILHELNRQAFAESSATERIDPRQLYAANRTSPGKPATEAKEAFPERKRASEDFATTPQDARRGHKFQEREHEMLTSVARTIGSTLGTIAARTERLRDKSRTNGSQSGSAARKVRKPPSSVSKRRTRTTKRKS